MKKCLKCEIIKPSNEMYGSGKYCSRSCANSRGPMKEETKKKISSTFEKKRKEKYESQCSFCKKTYLKRRESQRACSRSCSSKLSSILMTESKKESFSAKMSLIASKRWEENDPSIGFTTREHNEPSYPESIAIKFFKENFLSFEREKRVGRYFIDFAFNTQKIAIEIDGQQHKKKERILSDKKKDDFLKSQGWLVYRIPWPDENIRNKLTELKHLLL